MRIGIVRSAIIIGVMLATSFPVLAQVTGTFELDGNPTGDTFNITTGSGSQDVYVGEYNGLVTFTNTSPPGTTTYGPTPVYCIDPYADIYAYQPYNIVVPTPNSGESSLTDLDISGINDTVAQEIDYLSYNYLNVTSFSNGYDEADNQAAVQLAIWSLIDPPTSDYTSQAPADVATLEGIYQGYAQDYAASWYSNNLPEAEDVNVIQELNTGGNVAADVQEFVYVSPGSPTSNFGPVTPEPSFAAFVGSLVAAIGILALFKRRSFSCS